MMRRVFVRRPGAGTRQCETHKHGAGDHMQFPHNDLLGWNPSLITRRDCYHKSAGLRSTAFGRARFTKRLDGLLDAAKGMIRAEQLADAKPGDRRLRPDRLQPPAPQLDLISLP